MAAFPSNFHIAQVTLEDNDPFVESDTQSLIFRSNKVQAQRFEFKLTSTILEHPEVKACQAEIGAIMRDNDHIVSSFPIWSESNKDTATVTAPVGKGSHTISISDESDISIGDFFKPSGHNKAYQVTAIDTGQIEIRPKLVASVATSETLTFNGCTFRMKIKSKPTKYKLDGKKLSGTVLELHLVEKWT